MSKTTLYPILLFTLMLFSCSPRDAGNVTFLSAGVEMVSHKGVHLDSIAPPNSLDAIWLAYRAGFNTIEIDLNRTADNEIILLHDNHLNETFYTADEYKKLDSITFCFDWTLASMREKFIFVSPDSAKRTSVATLEEALQLCKKLNIYPYLEFKEYGFKDKLHLIDTSIKTAQKILGRNNFAVTSWYYEIAAYMRKEYPDLVVMCDPIHDIKILEKHRFSYFPNWEEIDPKIVEEQHLKGYTISTWTVDKTVLDSVMMYHVDKILTDNIAPAFDRAKAIYNKHSDHLFSSFDSEGEITENVMILQKGQSMELKDIDQLFIPFGAFHFSIEMKGKVAINATDFEVERENKRDNYLRLDFQYMIVNKTPQMKITALEDNTAIKSAWLAVSEY